jgi:sec-independent protein translocase protein TatB
MPSISPLELIVVAIVALIVFGPERLPEIARRIGQTASHIRRVAAEAQEEFRLGLDLDEDDSEDDLPPPRRPQPVTEDEASEGATEDSEGGSDPPGPARPRPHSEAG